MHALRRLELVAGVVSGVTGALGLAYAIFGPTYTYSGVGTDGTSSSGTASLAQVSLNPTSLTFFAVVLTCLTGVVAGAWVHASRAHGYWLLLACVVVLSVLTVISALSVGVFLLPAVVLAWLTLCSAAVAR